jgi:hypothetical protein
MARLVFMTILITAPSANPGIAANTSHPADECPLSGVKQT